MIQRIQTVFLLLAIIALSLFLWLPLIQLEATNYTEAIAGWDVRHYMFGYIVWMNAILTGVAIAFALIAVFLFGNRKLQSLLCWFSLLFTISASALVYYKYQTKVFMGDVILTWWNVLPLAAIALLILAIVFIRKDENLVKSLDRLR